MTLTKQPTGTSKSRQAVNLVSTDGEKLFNTGLKTFLVQTTSATYVSATGASGTANTAETVLTRTIPANALKAVGDRIRIRTWFVAQTGPSIVTTTSLGPSGSEVAVGDVSHTGGAAFDLTESWIHYIDNTHGNIIEQEAGVGIGNLTAVNVSGFTWNTEQNIIIAQSQVSSQYITIYGVFVDIFPSAQI